MKIYISKLDYRILGVVKSSEKPISTNKVADQVGISWQKAENQLILLSKKRLVSKIQTSKERYKWV